MHLLPGKLPVRRRVFWLGESDGSTAEAGKVEVATVIAMV